MDIIIQNHHLQPCKGMCIQFLEKLLESSERQAVERISQMILYVHWIMYTISSNLSLYPSIRNAVIDATWSSVDSS